MYYLLVAKLLHNSIYVPPSISLPVRNGRGEMYFLSIAIQDRLLIFCVNILELASSIWYILSFRLSVIISKTYKNILISILYYFLIYKASMKSWNWLFSNIYRDTYSFIYYFFYALLKIRNYSLYFNQNSFLYFLLYEIQKDYDCISVWRMSVCLSINLSLPCFACRALNPPP